MIKGTRLSLFANFLRFVTFISANLSYNGGILRVYVLGLDSVDILFVDNFKTNRFQQDRSFS